MGSIRSGSAITVVARIAIDYDRDIGEWEFATLPRAGELIAIRGDEGPMVLEVTGIIHMAASADSFGTREVPKVTLNTTLRPSN